MIRFYARTMIALGLAVAFFAVFKLALVAPPAPAAYFACPEGGEAHAKGCPYVDWGRKDLIRLAGRHAADKCGLCEHCLKGGSPPSTSSTQSRSPARAETARAQIQPSAD